MLMKAALMNTIIAITGELYAGRGYMGKYLGENIKEQTLLLDTVTEKSLRLFNTMEKQMQIWLKDGLRRVFKVVTKGSVIVIDNASFHRKDTLFDVVEEAGCMLIFLPKYSPDLNPIEHVWANMKNYLRNYTKNFDSLLLALADYFRFK